jgi:hypothetical protein
MSGGLGHRLKAIAIFSVLASLLLIAFTGISAIKADARASLRGYSTTTPESWEPMGFNVTGTAVKTVVDNLGWNVTKMYGNVGIGDGSTRAIDMVSNKKDVNFTDHYLMAGDVTTAPWDPSRLSIFNPPESEVKGANNTTNASGTSENVSNGQANVINTGAGNITLTIPRKAIDMNNNTSAGENNVTMAATEEARGAIALNDPYHSILFGRPVDDLMYEHPHALQACPYFRLTGLRVPDGSVADIGMRVVGYGY